MMEWSAESEGDDWRSRVIAGNKQGAAELPFWAEPCFRILHDEVVDDAYPCFFGVQAERRGEMFYAFVSKGAENTLLETMAKFAELAKLPAYQKNNIAVFFEPDPVPLSHQAYHDLFWHTLQLLHDGDAHPHAENQVDASDPAWEFCYQGIEMFVVCACPSFKKRHSRNLGPGMVLLFQPRSVFIDQITNKVIGKQARNQVRKRLRMWDDVEPHPDLGFYGDPGNLEWKQYFLPDENHAQAGACPFLRRRSNAAHESTRSLTPTQEGLWFLWRLQPDSAAYNLSLALEIEGLLDIGTLRQALRSVADRHPILHTRFLEVDGVPVQRTDPDLKREIDWAAPDLRREPDPMARACELLQTRGNRKFDLSTGRILRATVLRVSAARWILQLCTHQIVMDIQSLDALRREWLGSYTAGRTGNASRPRAESMRFNECAPKEKNESDSGTWMPQLLYWRERLSEATDALDLPFDRPRQAFRSATGGRLQCAIPSELHAGILRLASLTNATPFVVMLSTFALLLQRYSGQRDVRIAVPLLRRAPSIESATLGQFMNTAVVRLQVISTDCFTDLVEQAKRFLEEARTHGDLPFARLVQSLQVARSRSLIDTPLCQVSCNELPTFAPERRGELHIHPFDDAVGRAQYDLSLNVAIDDRGGALFFDYSTELFQPGTVQRLVTHHMELLSQLTESTGSAARNMACLQLSSTGGATSLAA